MRLINAFRKSILERAMGETNKAYYKKIEDTKKHEDKLATKCYNAIFTREIQSKVKALPDGWLRTDKCLRFNVNGMDIRLNSIKGVRVPSARHGCERLGVITGELADEVVGLMQEKERMGEANAQLYRKLEALLNSCSTFKMLEEVWPEGKPFYENYMKPQSPEKSGLPAVMVSEINVALKIGKAA